MRYEVRHFTLLDGWVNCWTSEDDLGNEAQVSFETVEDAKEDLKELKDSYDYAVSKGYMDGPGFEASEYRIFDTQTGEYVN